MSQSSSMTQGSPAGHILRFSIPLLIGNLFQQFYNMADSIVVGRFVGKTALAAVGSAFPVIFLLASLFMGLGMGATVMVSQYYGAKDMDKLQLTIDTMNTTVVLGSIPLTLLGLLFANPIIQMMAVPADVVPEFRAYLLIVLAGLIGTVGYNTNAGILQGLGDSKTPLLFLVIACIINIVLDLFFVLVVPWGVAGVAFATIIAQMFSWLYGVWYINRHYQNIKIRLLGFRFDKHIFKQIMRIGVPVSIQQAMFSVGIMAMQRLVNSYGSDFIAGYNGANKIDAIAFMPIQSFATAATTYVGQNIGAGRMDRVKSGTKAAVWMSIGVSMGVSAVLFFGGEVCMRLFSNEAVVIESGMAYLLRILPFYWMLAILFIFNGVIRGAGEANIPLISSVLALWLGRIPAAYLLAHFFGASNMHFCYVFGWALGLAITVPYYISGKWKTKGLTSKSQSYADA